MKTLINFFLALFATEISKLANFLEHKFTLGVKAMYPEGTDLRGSSRGTTHSKNKYGNYLKKKSIPTLVRNSYTTGVRSQFTSLTQSWRSLTQAQRNAWDLSAKNFPQKNVFGFGFVWSGQNFFMSVNRNLDAIGVARITSPPNPTAVQPILLASVIANTTGGLLTLNFSPPINAGTSVLAQGTQGVSAGKKSIGNLLRQFSVLDDTNLTGGNSSAAYVTKFGALPAVGTKIEIKFRPIDEATGLPGGESTAQAIAI